MDPSPLGLTNEPNIIATIENSMQQLEALATEYGNNYAEQWQVFTKDINAPAEPGRFTDLNERQTLLVEEYHETKSGIIRQISHYDEFCGRQGLDYSTNWDTLLDKLRPYLIGPSALDAILKSNRALSNVTSSSASAIPPFCS